MPFLPKFSMEPLSQRGLRQQESRIAGFSKCGYACATQLVWACHLLDEKNNEEDIPSKEEYARFCQHSMLEENQELKSVAVE